MTTETLTPPCPNCGSQYRVEPCLTTDEEASDFFNSLPLETRKALCVHANFVHIRHLESEKQRLKKGYERSVLEINQQIKNLQESIRRG